MPASKMRSIDSGRRKVYERLRGKGMSKSVAAAIANKGVTKKGRQAMARKSANTRRKR